MISNFIILKNTVTLELLIEIGEIMREISRNFQENLMNSYETFEEILTKF